MNEFKHINTIIGGFVGIPLERSYDMVFRHICELPLV